MKEISKDDLKFKINYNSTKEYEDMIKKKNDYIFRLNYFRYNLAHAEESKNLPPFIVEQIMAHGLEETRRQMKEDNIVIEGYND
jgi:hypothetical protein